MPTFQIKNEKATKIEQKEFKNELELHRIVDKNLKEIFELRFIKDEHITDKHGRIETLAIDEANRPIVIEYKKNKEPGQLTQANRYMTWIKQNPDSFELLVRKNINNFTGKIDFLNPRILCFAQEYSINDKCLALSIGAELWKYRYYENDTLVILREEEPEQLIKSSAGNSIIQKIKRSPRIAKTVEQHLKNASKELRDLFFTINDLIIGISSEIEQYTTNSEIIYKTSFNFAYLSIQNSNNRLRYLLRTENDNIKDPKNLTKIIPKTHGYGKITRTLFVSPAKLNNEYKLENIYDILIQAYSTTQ